MRFVRFRDDSGNVRTGTWHADRVTAGGDTFDGNTIDILAPTEPEKIVCVGLNYHAHAEEAGHSPPERPRLFLKPPTCVTDPGVPITVPDGKDRIEPEVELGIVIESQCRHVSTDTALEYVWGYTCVNDLSNRDDQLGGDRSDMVRGKAFDNAAPIGPVIATPDAVPADATLELRVNDELHQQATRDDMIFSEAELIAEISSYITLNPGDVIATGTPAGPPRLRDGDVVELSIEGIGTFENTIFFP